MEPKEGSGGGEGIDVRAEARKDGYLRIYVGGLGGNVTVDDLKKTFSSPQLGTVKSVEVIRTKGRSFAYLDFCPCSDKGLAKLFSTYNGCMWKGERLRLEKAKEHYELRLRREWEEDAALSSLPNDCVEGTVEIISPLEKPVKDHNSENTHLRIFFPKLRKVKPLPFKGSGKHKYSFQRIEVPPLPIHFCDCDEHSGPADTAKVSYNQENEIGGVNEEELNIMKTVMNKLIEQEKFSQIVHSNIRLAAEAQIPTISSDDLQVDEEAAEMSDEDNLILNMVQSDDKITLSGSLGENTITITEELQPSKSSALRRKHGIQGKKPFYQDNISKLASSKVGYASEAKLPIDSKDDFQLNEVEDELSDEDDLIINAVAGSKDKITLTDSWGQKTIAGNEDKQACQPVLGKRGIQGKRTEQSNKKYKAASDGEGWKIGKPYDAQMKGNLHDTSDDLYTYSDIQVAKPGKVVQQSSHDNLHARKFSWRDLVSGRDDGCFRISDVITSGHSAVEKKLKSDPSDVLNQENQRTRTSKVKVVNKSSEVVSQMPIAEASKAGKGTAWMQKSSWKHLVGGSVDSSFSISQIVPGMNLQKEQELVQVKDDTSALKNSRQNNLTESGNNTDTLIKSSPDEASLNLLNPLKKPQVGKSGEEACSLQPREKQLTPAKEANLRDNGSVEISFKRSNASLKEWKMAKARLSGSHKKKVSEI